MDNLLSVEWTKHKSTLLSSLSLLRNQQLYTDVTIACERKFYRVHKLVLSTCSDFFRDMLAWTDSKNPVVVLKDIKYQNLEALLDYMYLGLVKVRNGDLISFLEAAKCLEIKGLSLSDIEPHSRENMGTNESQTRIEYVNSCHPSERDGTVIPNAHSSTPSNPMNCQISAQRQSTNATERQSPATLLHQQNSVGEKVYNTIQNNQGTKSIDPSESVLKRATEDWGYRVKTYDLCSDGSYKVRDRNDGAPSGANKAESESCHRIDVATFPQHNTLNSHQGHHFDRSSIAAPSSVQQVKMLDWKIGGSTSSYSSLIDGLPDRCLEQNAMVMLGALGTSITPLSNQQIRKGSRSMGSGTGAIKTGSGLKFNVRDQWYPSTAHMARHASTHTGERLHRCHICCDNFTLKEQLHRHLATIHGAYLLPAVKD